MLKRMPLVIPCAPSVIVSNNILTPSSNHRTSHKHVANPDLIIFVSLSLWRTERSCLVALHQTPPRYQRASCVPILHYNHGINRPIPYLHILLWREQGSVVFLWDPYVVHISHMFSFNLIRIISLIRLKCFFSGIMSTSFCFRASSVYNVSWKNVITSSEYFSFHKRNQEFF